MTDKKIKILIVDDDIFLLNMYAPKFEKAGLEVDIAKNGVEAEKKIKENEKPDIILLDIIMPILDGMDFLKKIREEKLIDKTTVVMLTNQADDQNKAEEIGVDGFIVKAMTIPSEVVAKVMDIYNKKN